MKRETTIDFLTGLQLSIRASLAGVLALAIAHLLELPQPIYALIAAVIVSDLSPARTRHLGMQRILGSVIGAVVGGVVCELFPPAIWAVGLGVLAAMVLAFLLRLKDAARLAGFVCGIVVFGYDDRAWTYSFFRLAETILGIVLAVLIGCVPKLVSFDERRGA